MFGNFFTVPLACTYSSIQLGSSSDYGVDKAMKETTLAMLQENGLAFAAQEKENNKVREDGRLYAGLRCAWALEPSHVVAREDPPFSPG